MSDGLNLIPWLKSKIETHLADKANPHAVTAEQVGAAGASHTHAQSAVTGLTDALAGKAASSHVHAAGDITSGSLAVERGGTGGTTAAAARTNLGAAATGYVPWGDVDSISESGFYDTTGIPCLFIHEQYDANYAMQLKCAEVFYYRVKRSGVWENWRKIIDSSTSWNILWTNGSPSSDFAASSVTIAGLSNYNLFAVGVAYSAAYPTDAGGNVFYIPGTSAFICHPEVTWYETYISACLRPVTINRGSNLVTFGTGVRVTHAAKTSAASYAIPLYILGAAA